MDDSSQMLQPPRPTPAFSALAIALLLMVLTFGAFITIGAVTQVMNIAFGIWFTEILIFLGVPFAVTQAMGRDPLRFPRVTPLPGAPVFVIGALLGVVNLFAVGMPLQAVSHLLAPQWLTDKLDPTHVFKEQTSLELTFVLLGVAVLAPVCEEYFFRGVFLRGLQERLKSDWSALIVSGLWFSLAHLEPLGLLARWELGILFGWLYLRTRSLWPGVMAHAANNLSSSVLYFLSKDAAETQPSPSQLGASELKMVLVLALFCAGPMIALLRYAQRTLRPVVTEDDPAVRAPRSLWSAAAPWLVVALLSLAGLFAIDRRGIELNWIDQRYPLPKTEIDERTQARKELSSMRAAARHGQIPIETYEAERKRLSSAD